MVYIIALIIIVFIIYKRGKKKLLRLNNEAEVAVLSTYEIVKIDEEENFVTTEGKEIILDGEKARIINFGILASLVAVLFPTKVPRISIIEILRWTLELARNLGYTEKELMGAKSYFYKPRANAVSEVYADYQKELRIVIELLIGNFEEINKTKLDETTKRALRDESISTLIADIKIVLTDFLSNKNYPSRFDQLGG